jgi:hypothetical protein
VIPRQIDGKGDGLENGVGEGDGLGDQTGEGDGLADDDDIWTGLGDAVVRAIARLGVPHPEIRSAAIRGTAAAAPHLLLTPA